MEVPGGDERGAPRSRAPAEPNPHPGALATRADPQDLRGPQLNLLVAFPVKPFGIAKGRLAPVLSPSARSRLGKAILGHTLGAAEATGALVAVVTGDPGVARWTKGHGYQVIPELPEHGTGLNGAARAVVATAQRQGMPWAVVHADLPLLATGDLTQAFRFLKEDRVVLAPSRDGGTNLVAGATGFSFAYGPASFHRHLGNAVRAGLRPEVVVRTGLALDLDDPEDLSRLRALPRGAWIEEHI